MQAILQDRNGKPHYWPLLCSFSKTIDGQTFVFLVTCPLHVYQPGDDYIVSEEQSGAKCGPAFQTTMREGVLPGAQAALDRLITKHGAARVRATLASATAVGVPQ